MLPAHIIEQLRPGQLVQHFLLSSYCYYVAHITVMEDPVFDRLCERLREVYGTFDHQHLHLIDEEMLDAGSAFNLREEDYPLIVRMGYEEYFHKCNDGSLQRLLEEHFDATAAPRRISRRLPTAAPALVAAPVRRISRTPRPAAPAPVAAVRRISRTR